MDLKNISTEDLARELQLRKEKEIPDLVAKINECVNALRMLGKEIEYTDDTCCSLGKVYIENNHIYYEDYDY